MTHLVSRKNVGPKRVLDVTTGTHNFYAYRQNGQQGTLVHNSHQLTPGALDAMLKHLEENVPGSEDKRLVCIFSTTEPEKMKLTILSRCAPAFVIQAVPPSLIATRLEKVCQIEKIPYELDMLLLIAEMTESHIRDALKAIEGVSMLGAINKENVISYLRLDLNSSYLDILENLGPGRDLSLAMQAAKKLLTRVSPVTCYEKLADLSILAYQVLIGAANPPVYLDVPRMTALGQAQQLNLLNFASRFSNRPGRPSASMLFCDLGNLQSGIVSSGISSVMMMPAQTSNSMAVSAQSVVSDAKQVLNKSDISSSVVQNDNLVGKLPYKAPNLNDSVVPLRGSRASKTLVEAARKETGIAEYSPSEFCQSLAYSILELDGISGSKGRADLDNHRAFPSRGGDG